MPRLRFSTLSRYLFNGQFSTQGCLKYQTRTIPRAIQSPIRLSTAFWSSQVRDIHTKSTTSHLSNSTPSPVHVPLRKQLKDEAKKQKALGKKKKKNASNQVVDGWELTVGIEIHAQLNTAKKLFSTATTSFNDDPNSHVAFFDLATPGSQPVFQKKTLIPALRAALALGCNIQSVSRFDRKHYFHWDQPSGYQITQYYEPFARDGRIILQARDGIATEDGDGVSVGIQQIQMEQDTAKTLAQPGEVHWIDFNRVGMPLIEIITLPDIHHPATAAALVRKVQALLNAADSCISGMEAGGLRADVNVSVRRSDSPSAPLGQRTEIKNLSSFKAVEDAIIAERDRQISVLESGGKIESETRGWSIGSTETCRLRGKEGEVDYRYMPDPDLAPVIIGDDLVSHLRESMGELPDAEVDELIQRFGLTPKDALSLVVLDGGNRVEYFWNIVDLLTNRFGPDSASPEYISGYQLAANWILHELGRLTSGRSEDDAQGLKFTEDGQCDRVPVRHLVDILLYLYQRKITAKVAKELLWAVFRRRIPDEYATIDAVLDEEDLWFDELNEDEYIQLALNAAEGQDEVVRQFIDYKQYPQGKLMFLVGRMIRLGAEERIDPKEAERVMKHVLEETLVPAINN
ncbi:GatB/GatE catalytic domain-containing protein [Daldinia grandis]|nr:GatB/GatE catalytic domain-containing protein [Daldinia grandis]